jgi:sulfur relay (sulfurtransferase) DsrC/TusE family protein
MVTNEELIEELQDYAEEIGETPTKRKMNLDGRWTGKTYQRHFGSWNEAVKAAGLDINLENDVVDSEEELLQDLRDFAEEIGKTPSRRKMNLDGPWDGKTYRVHFGSWNKAVKAAGLDVNSEHKIANNKEELLQDLRDFAEEIGETPNSHIIKKKCAPWSLPTYRKYFGTFDTALYEAGFDNFNSERVVEEEKRRNVYHFPDKERDKIIQRDGGECRVCGSNEKIEVHHIMKRFKVPKQEKLNDSQKLITLCREHHMMLDGKWEEANHNEFEELAREHISEESDDIQQTIESF